MKSKKLCIVIGIVIVFFIFRCPLFFTYSLVKDVSSCFLYPVLRVQQFIVEHINQWSEQRGVVSGLRQTCALLKKENKYLCAENIALQACVYYAQEIDEIVQFKNRYNAKNAVVAQVLVRHLSENDQFFLVNAGANTGIKKDMVALYDNCLLGKVVEVYPWYCKVCLITDSGCNVAAVCAGTGVSGILEGGNTTDALQLNYVSHLCSVKEGDMVLSSGEGLVFPYGFGLGKMSCVTKGDLFYTITVAPLVDFYSLRYCLLCAKEEIEKRGMR